jgi:hypothetical protein
MRVVWMKMVVAVFCLQLAPGCSHSQLEGLRDGIVGIGSCSLHTTLACAAQAVGGCSIPDASWGSDQWSGYAQCVAEKSGRCSAAGLGRCALTAATRAAGGAPIVMGGVGCDQDKVAACVGDTTIETEVEAVEAVASCQRTVCLKGE